MATQTQAKPNIHLAESLKADLLRMKRDGIVVDGIDIDAALTELANSGIPLIEVIDSKFVKNICYVTMRHTGGGEMEQDGRFTVFLVRPENHNDYMIVRPVPTFRIPRGKIRTVKIPIPVAYHPRFAEGFTTLLLRGRPNGMTDGDIVKLVLHRRRR